jgi:hypothetical protein
LEDDPKGFLDELGRVCTTLDPNIIMESRHDALGKRPLPGILRGQPPLASVAAFFGSNDVLRLLVSLSLNPKAVDAFGRTLAHFATAGGSFDCCRELDFYGVGFESRDGEGRPPAEYAAEWGRFDILQWMWIRGYLNAMIEEWKAAGAEEPKILRVVAQFGHSEVLKFLIDVLGAPVYKKGHRFLNTAVHAACEGGHGAALQVLLKRGANPRNVDEQRRMPAVLAIESGSLSCVKLLHAKGALTKARRVVSPVVEAARFGHLDVLRFLVDEAGFDVNATGGDLRLKEFRDGDVGRETALVAAAEHGHWDCARLVLRRGGLDARPLMWATVAALDGCDDFITEVSKRADLGSLVVGELPAGPYGGVPWDSREKRVRLMLRFSTRAWFRAAIEHEGGKGLIQLAIEVADPALVKVAAEYASLINEELSFNGLNFGGPRFKDCCAGLDLLAPALLEIGASLTTRQIGHLGLLSCLPEGVALRERLSVVAKLQPDWRGLTANISSSGADAWFALERGATLGEYGLEGLLRHDAFTAEELRVLPRFDWTRPTLVRAALRAGNIQLLRALAPVTREELELGPSMKYWRCSFGPRKIVKLAQIDRRLGITCALKSGDRAVLEAIRRAGFVPTAGELGAVDWFPMWRWVGLDAIAEWQPDWSESSSAAASIKLSDSLPAMDLARQHHAPGF